MTSKEIEARSGIPRANIRYYETEGLLAPFRSKNGYRDYSEEDLAVLEKIKLLRRLGVSVEDLRALQAGTKTLAAVLEVRLDELQEERLALDAVEAVCGQLREENPSFASLEPAGYLQTLDRRSRPPELPAGDRLPVGAAPVRRFFARTFDDLLITLLILLATCLLGKNPAHLSSALLTILPIAIMAAVEPLLLHLFGTTPGKALLGLRLYRADGGRLTYEQGFTRLVYMAWYGYGLCIPIWSLIQQYRCLNRGFEEEPQPWDEEIAYETRPFRWQQPAALAVAGLLATVLTEGANRLSQLPTHRGDLTVAEFAENFNRQAEYLGFDFRATLDSAGNWVETPRESSGVVISLGEEREQPSFQYTVEEGILTAVSFSESIVAEEPVGLSKSEMLTAAAAFAWGRDSVSFLGTQRKDLLAAIERAKLLEDFSHTCGDVTLTYEVEAEGLLDIGWAFLPDEGTPGKCDYTFTLAVAEP